MDKIGNKNARKEIALIKVGANASNCLNRLDDLLQLVAPAMAQRVVDRAIQVHGAAGLSQDLPLAQFYQWARVLRMADGPDEVGVTDDVGHILKHNEFRALGSS